MPVRPTKEPSERPLEHSRYESASGSPGFLFWRTYNCWQRQMRSGLDELGITQAQYSILATTSYLISQQLTPSQQDVANRLEMDKMMVSDVVKVLAGRHWISRRPSERDGRAFVLELTRTGRGLLKRATPVVEAIDERFFGVLTTADRAHLMKCLVTLTG